jgi:hypothetical protein
MGVLLVNQPSIYRRLFDKLLQRITAPMGESLDAEVFRHQLTVYS